VTFTALLLCGDVVPVKRPSAPVTAVVEASPEPCGSSVTVCPASGFHTPPAASTSALPLIFADWPGLMLTSFASSVTRVADCAIAIRTGDPVWAPVTYADTPPSCLGTNTCLKRPSASVVAVVAAPDSSSPSNCTGTDCLGYSARVPGCRTTSRPPTVTS